MRTGVCGDVRPVKGRGRGVQVGADAHHAGSCRCPENVRENSRGLDLSSGLPSTRISRKVWISADAVEDLLRENARRRAPGAKSQRSPKSR